MNVKLISHTEPSAELREYGVNTLGEFIAYVARVSNPGNQHNTKTAPRLLRYLREHSHWSPFEMASICMEICTTRDIARQILRHRSFSFQEFSQRYAVVESDWDYREARLQDTTNRQNSFQCTDPEKVRLWDYMQREVGKSAQRAYDWALDNGIAKEQARAVLPEGLTVSTLYMSGTVRSWIHYVGLRSGPETQREHQEIARACGRILGELGISWET